MVVARQRDTGSLTRSVTVSNSGFTLALRDDSNREHTAWGVLLNPPGGGKPQWILGLWRNLEDKPASWASAPADVPAGTYQIAVYQADGHVPGRGEKYWTPDHLVAQQEVDVP